MKQTVESPGAPAAVGAYSQATTDGSTLYTAGQIPLTSDGDLLDEEPVDVQIRRCLENVRAIVDEGGTLEDVLSVTVYLADIDDSS